MSKLPFTIGYLVGLIGTFWATLIARSYIFTAIFAVLQAGSLIYFLLSYIPGGTKGIGLFFKAKSESEKKASSDEQS